MNGKVDRWDSPPDGATDEPALASSSNESGVHRSPERSSRIELAPGALIAGKYRVREVLGRGGFAVVYAAEHVSLGRELALKVLHRDDTTHAVLLERFAREMRISALMRHPHVLEVYDAGELEDGSPFLVMEKISGRTLQQQLDAERRLAIDDALELGTQLAWALAALGERGIVHRDIKPENLMLARKPDGALHLKLVDFGISLVRQEPVDSRLTQRGTLLGTPHYMAPEQLRSQVLDARIDLYAAGVVLYQALTGHLPYNGDDLSSLTLNVLNGQARSVRELRPDCPHGLARVIERALARDPEDRYPDAAALLSDLLVCRAEQSAPAGARLRALARFAHAHAKPLAVALIALSTALSMGGDALPRQEGAWRDREPGPLAHADELLLAQALPAAGASSSAPSDRAAGELDATPAGGDAGAAQSLTQAALTLLLQGDAEAAHTTYARALRADPTHTAALRGLGLAAARLARNDEARAAFTRYLELAPQAPDARAVRARLAQLPPGGVRTTLSFR
jgi:tRNA A-37 threonylcarbamoyl transferase component Bud32